MTRATKAVVAFCSTCGKLSMASVIGDDSPSRRKTAKDLAEAIRSGRDIQTMLCEDVRAGEWCDCRSKKKMQTPELFPEKTA